MSKNLERNKIECIFEVSKTNKMKVTYITIVYILDGITKTWYGKEYYDNYTNEKVITRNKILYRAKVTEDTYKTEVGETNVKHVTLKPIGITL